MNRTTSGVLKGLLLVTSALVASTVLGSSAARAGGPTGGSVVVGSATISTPSSTSTVVNQSSNKALINWDAFSIPGGSSVVFNQPTASSITVNRVIGPNASAIDGRLLANGNVWLINSNGILFGQGAQVNVGGLLATTSDIDDDDFRNNRFRFTKPSANPDAAVINKGTITVGQGGSIILSGSRVSNEGVIKADLGSVVLGGARTFSIDLYGDNLIRYQIGEPVTEAPKGADGKPAALFSNSGTISASGGTVLMTARAVRNVENNVINNTGVVEANSVSTRNGEVILDAGTDGTADVGGTISASGANAGETGGAISVTGGTVNVSDGAKLDASGDSGGGKIEIGGGLHGQGMIANSQITNVGKATITVDAKTSGNGGSVAIWSNGQTTFNGNASAKGGVTGGDGGTVETSGGNLQVGSNAAVDTSAPNGLTGIWLLDPTNINVSTGGTDDINGSNMSPATIIAALSSTNVFLEATNDITINSAISYSSSHSFSLFASGDLTFNASVQNSGNGSITGVGGWDPAGSGTALGNAGSFGNNGGSIYLGGSSATGGVAVGSVGGLTRMFGDAVLLDATNGYAQLGYHDVTGGDIDVHALGALTLAGGVSRTAQVGNGSTFGSTSGGGAISLTAPSIVSSGTGYVAGQSADIVLTSDGSDGGAVGSVANPLQVAVAQLAIQTDGANAYVKSPGAGLSIGVGTDGIDVGTGVLSIVAAGPITQTRSIVAASVNLSATNGSITLSDSGNAFNTAALTTVAGDVTLYDSTALTTTSANVDGDLSLTSAGAIGQTGAIQADALSVTTTNGEITLANTGNAFASITLSGGGTHGATIYDKSAFNIVSASVATTLALTGEGDIQQSGALHANTLNVTSTGGVITLINTGNAFNATSVTTSTGDASLYDASALTVASASVNGNLSLSSAGTIGQTGAIHAAALNAASTGGAITLTNSGNAFAAASLSTVGSFSASLYDGSALTISSASIGGDLVLTGGSSIGQSGAIHSNKLNVSASGAISLTNTGNTFGPVTIVTSGLFDASLYDASALTVASANVGGALMLTGAAGISQTGAIVASALNAITTNGAIVLTNSGNSFATVSLWTSGSDNATLFDSVNFVVSGANVGGALSLTGGGSIGQTEAIHAASLSATTTNGAIDLSNTGNAFATATLTTAGADDASLYDSAALSIVSATVGGDLTLAGASSIGQSGAIHAASLNVSTTSGPITLTNAGNSFGPLTVATGASGDASIYDAPNLVVASANVGGTLTLSSGGSISQTGAIHAGTLNATTTHGAITLTNAGNTFATATLATGGSDDASLYDASNLTVSSANIGGTLALSGGGSIGQAGAIHAAALNVSTTGGAIVLSNTANSFASATTATSGTDDATLYDASALSITSANVGGTLNLTSAGAISQAGAIHAAVLNVTSTGGAITLLNTGNAFNTASLTTSGAYDASLYDASNLTISGANIGGDLALSGGGSIGQSGAIHADALSVVTTHGSIALNNTGNTFNTLTVSTAGADDASFYNASALTVTSANVGGTLTLAGALALGQSGAVHAAALNVSTTGGDIVLTNTGNTFASATISTSANHDATLYDASSLIVSSATVGRVLTLTGAGSIGQTGVIHAATLNVTTTGGPIALTNTGNAFDTATLSTSGSNDAALTDSTNLVIASATVGGTLTLTGGGSIGQTGAIHAAAVNVATTGGPINLTNAGNAFGTAAIGTSGTDNVSLSDSVNLTIASADVGDTLTLTVMGSVGQTGAIHANALTVTADTIALTNSGNAFHTATLTASGSVSLYDSIDLTVVGANIGSDLNLSGNGAIGQTGAIHADALSVTTTGGVITLTNTGNTFDTVALSTSGTYDASLYDLSNLIVTSATVGGDMNLTGGGSIGQTGAIHANALNVTATGGPILLTNTGNTFHAASLATSGSDDASLYDSIGLALSRASVGGDLTLASGGTISQTGAIHATSLNVATTNGSISLTNVGNAFGPLTVSTGGSDDATLYDSVNLVVAGANVGGTLTLSSAGSIGQTGAIHAAALNASTTGGDIVLTNTGNVFATATLSTQGSDDATLYDSTDLVIAGATIGGTLTLSGGGAISQSGAIHAAALNVSTAGGDISLTNAGNAFAVTTVSTDAAGDATLYTTSNMIVASANVGGTLTLSGGGSIGQTGAIHAASLDASTTHGDILLTNTGNAFGTATLSTAGSDNASLYDSVNLTIASAAIGGTLMLTGAGSIGQAGAILAAVLNVTTANGGITLLNTGNSFATAALSTSGSDGASLYDATNLSIVSANVGGTLMLSTGGAISQSGAIHAAALNVSTAGGAITLANTGNTFGPVSVSTSGSDSASLYDLSNLVIESAAVGGDLTLSSAGSISQTGAIHSNGLAATAAGGTVVLTNSGNAFNTTNLTTSGAFGASLYDASSLTIAAASIGGDLALSGGSSIAQSGAIHANGLSVATTNGSVTLNNTGNSFNTLIVSVAGTDNASLYDASALSVTSANVGGTLALSGEASIGQTGAIHAAALNVATMGGAIVLANAGNAFGMTTVSTSGTDNATLYDASALTIASGNVGGTLTLLGGNGIGQSGAIQAGALNVSTTHGAIQLTNAGNSFATVTISTAGPDAASISDSVALTIAGANVGGGLALTGGGAITQFGAIHAGSLNVSTTAGSITLTNSGNTFGPLTASTSGSDNASLSDASALVLAGANVGGALTLSGGSTISQTGALHAASVSATTTNGVIDLSNTGNTFGTATLATSGSDNAALYDGSILTIASASIGGDLTLSGGGSIGQSGAIHTHALNVSSTGGAINLGNIGNTFNMLTVSTVGSNAASLYDASALIVASANIGGALTLTSGGALGQSGAIHASALNATTTSGNITLTNTGNGFATVSLTTSGTDNASVYDASALTVAGAVVGGSLNVSSGGAISQSGVIQTNNLTIASTGGAITLNVAGNAFNTINVSTSGTNSAAIYDSSALTVAGANVGGGLTVLSQHDLTFVSSVQAKTGLLAVAGWDGTTTDPAALVAGNAFGNGGGSIVIGGAGATGDVAVGSQGGTTTVAGANVSVTATNGYAQLGYHGAGTDAISVYAKGNVTLTGGAQTARFAQIGNGGYQLSVNQSGDIYISATGAIALNGGAGQAAYAQIGHGGAQSNSNTSGYSDTGLVTVIANTAALSAGTGTGSYAQIGHGGYLSGQSLASGTATLGGNISVTTVSGIALTGNGTAAYAQIGHGGDLVNSNAANGASGTISGNITATVSTKPSNPATDPVSAIAGSGDESYAQIGNGGSGENAPVQGASVAFTISGNILISDLKLRGSNTGPRGYAQIGNGDASKKGTGNVGGDITIDNGFTIDSVNGSAPDTSSLIGNQTGFGTVTGLVTFLSAPPPPPPPPPPTVGNSGGAIAVVIQKPTETIGTSPIVVLTTPVASPPPLYSGDLGTTNHGPGPLEQLVDNNSDGKNSEGEQASDSVSESLGKSLDAGSHKVSGSETLLPGLTKQLGRKAHPVPPADVDYSSWGNEALWL